MMLISFHKSTSSNDVSPAASKAPPLSSLEEEELRKQRKRFDDEMEAFQQMLNYNADVAYGINKEK